MLNSDMNKSLVVLGCLLFLLGIAFQGKAQSPGVPDTTDFQFWYASFDARSMALANATVADPLNNNSLYSNPGLLPFNAELPGLTAHSVYNTSHNIFIENLTLSQYRGNDRKLVAGVTMINNGPDRLHSVNPSRQLTFTQFNIDIAYGQMLNPSLSFGFNVNASYGTVETSSLFTANTSLGVVYAPSPMISYGLVFKGSGYQNDWLGSGLSYYRPAQEETQISTTKMPQRLEVGATLRFPSLAEHPDIVLSLSNEKMFGEPGLIYRGGLEIYPSNSLTLRGGYFHSPSIKGARLGLGLLLNPFNLNYTYTDNNLDLSGKAHMLSISIDI